MLIIKNGSIIDREIILEVISETIEETKAILPLLDKSSEAYRKRESFISRARLTLALLETAQEA